MMDDGRLPCSGSIACCLANMGLLMTTLTRCGQWSQLLLEQSALSAHGRVEKLAAERFSMVVPGRQDIVLVPLMSPVANR